MQHPMFNLPPMKFRPILKSVIWGGEKILPFKGINDGPNKIGESWEISGVKGNESVVDNGPDQGVSLTNMIARYKGALVGDENYRRFGTTFPLLVKIIDAAGDLSLQVHPDDKLASKRHDGSLGKTEMWYIVDTDEGATILSGLNKELTPEEYACIGADPGLLEYVARHESHPGDVFFLPAGRIHGIGAGNLLVEVQETSDITYRIFDYGRVDAKTGKTRELHVDQAKDAIDYKVYPDYVGKAGEEVDGVSELVTCSHFTVDRVRVDGRHRLLMDNGSFLTLTCTEGHVDVTDDRGNTVVLKKGESMLVPAMAKYIDLEGVATIISATN